MKNLNKLYKECLSELASIDIKPGKITSVTSTKAEATSKWGTCYYTKSRDEYRITINKRILQDDVDEKAVKQTIIHEILHACTKCNGHKGEWKRLARKVNVRLGYDVTRTTGNEKFGLKQEDLNWKYILVCDSCGNKFYRTKFAGPVANPSRYHCQCGGRLERYTKEDYLKHEKEEERLLNEELGYV